MGEMQVEMPRQVIQAFGYIKKAAAEVNIKFGLNEEKRTQFKKRRMKWFRANFMTRVIFHLSFGKRVQALSQQNHLYTPMIM